MFDLNKVFNKVFIVIFIFLILIPLKSVMAFDDKDYNHKLQIINGKKEALDAGTNKVITEFDIKIANSKSGREKGLMFIKNLPGHNGLLLDFKEEQMIHMWMKNTLISLDMLFITKDNRIVRIVSSTTPLSLEIISSKLKVRKVLEINSGLTQKFKIKVGDTIRIIE